MSYFFGHRKMSLIITNVCHKNLDYFNVAFGPAFHNLSVPLVVKLALYPKSHIYACILTQIEQ